MSNGKQATRGNPVSKRFSAEEFAQSVDLLSVLALAVLLIVGIATVYSASAVLAVDKHGRADFFLYRHLGAVVLGLVALWGAVQFPLQRWQSVATPLLLVSFCLLLAVFVPGVGQKYNGAARWIQFGPVRFQPAEFAKLAIVLFLAHSLSKNQALLGSFFHGFLPYLLIVTALVALILRQPDMGSSALIVALLFIMLFVAGCRLVFLTSIVFLSVPAFWIYVQRHPHAANRLTAFLAPEENRFDIAYQTWQSLVAFGSGGFLGMGLGEGNQKLFFLPEPHTDFVFATIGQELGLLGVVIVMGCFAIVLGRGLLAATRLSSKFEMFLCFGIVAWLAIQSLLNMGVALAMLPTKGLTLPLISYGRSSMVISLVGVGILLRASAEVRLAATWSAKARKG